jgi:cytochrome c
MDFLKDVATPQSIEHFHLLLFVLNVILIAYVPYLGVLLGSAFVSYRLERRYRREQSGLSRTVAGDVMSTALQDRKAVIFMGVVPSLALVFVFTQLLQGTTAMSVALLAFSSMSLVGGVSFLWAFRFTFRFRRILERVDAADASDPESVPAAVQENDSWQTATGRLGVALVSISAFLLAAGLALSANPAQWTEVDGILSLALSANVLVKFAHMLAIAAGMTGGGILFYLDRPDKGTEYRSYVRRLGRALVTASILLQPLFVLLTVVLTPKAVLSAMLFGLGGASLLAFLLAGIFLYGASKEPDSRWSGYAFSALVIAVALLMTNEQVAVHNATVQHAVVLASEYEKLNEAFKASLGITTASVTGEEIYNGRCSACHLPDARKVGPPFKYVAAKYALKLDALVTFISNPVKVDPNYPSMPNQGLRPAEVDSIANYVLRTFGGAKPVPAPNSPSP